MKKLNLFIVVALMSIFILDSCSIQKRYHRKGFTVNWNHTSIGGKKDKFKASSDFENEENNSIVATPNTFTLESTTNEYVIKETNYEQLENEQIFADKGENLSTTFSSNKKVENVNITTKSIEKKDNITLKQTRDLKKLSKKETNKSNSRSDVPVILLFILCFILPPLAVGIATDWDLTPILWNLVWCLVCGVPGIVHAIIHVLRNR